MYTRLVQENDVKTDNRCNEKRYVVPARCLFEQRNEKEKNGGKKRIVSTAPFTNNKNWERKIIIKSK